MPGQGKECSSSSSAQSDGRDQSPPDQTPCATTAAQPSGCSRPSEGCARTAGEQQHLKPRQSNSLTGTRHGACKSLRSNLDAPTPGVLHLGTERGCDVSRREPLCAWLAPGEVCAPRGTPGAAPAPLRRGSSREAVLLLRASLSRSAAGSSNREIASKVETGGKRSPRSSQSILNYSRLREGLRRVP